MLVATGLAATAARAARLGNSVMSSLGSKAGTSVPIPGPGEDEEVDVDGIRSFTASRTTVSFSL